MGSELLERDGVGLYYEDHGSGPAILLTHGYAWTSDMWRGQVEALAAEFRVITWDLRGHGRSDSPPEVCDYIVEPVVMEDMAALLDACGVNRAVVGGHSLGGFLSLAFHVKHPERVRALMLFDTGPGYRNDDAREGWNRSAEARARAFEEKGLEALARGEEKWEHRSADGLARAARGTLAQVDSRVIDSLPGIAVPTLALVGEKDRLFLAGTEYMASKIPGAAHIVVPDAGHAVNLHQPEAFNEAVLTFLRGVDAD